MHFVVLDFETLNPSRRSGFSFCAMKFESGERRHSVTRRFAPADSWVSLWAIKSFGVSQGEVDHFKPFKEVWQEVEAMFRGDVFVVCHNAPFDMSVLRNCLTEFNCSVEEFQFVCSLAIAKRTWPSLTRHGLADLTEHLGIELNHHDPESDCMATGQIFMKQMEKLGVEITAPNEMVLQRLLDLDGKLVKRSNMEAHTNEF